MVGFGLDLAPTHSGIVVTQDEQLLYSVYLTHTTWIEGMIQVVKISDIYYPDWVAIEGSYYGKNPKVHADINKMLGSIELWCELRQIPWFEGKTSQIDSACVIKATKGNRKKDTRSFAERLFPGESFSEDETDAVCVNFWGAGEYKKHCWSQQDT